MSLHLLKKPRYIFAYLLIHIESGKIVICKTVCIAIRFFIVPPSLILVWYLAALVDLILGHRICFVRVGISAITKERGTYFSFVRGRPVVDEYPHFRWGYSRYSKGHHLFFRMPHNGECFNRIQLRVKRDGGYCRLFVFIDSTHGWEVRRITIILSAVNL